MPVTLNRNATGVLRTARLICSENETQAPEPISKANEHAHHVSCLAGVVALVLVTGLFLKMDFAGIVFPIGAAQGQ